MSRVKLRSLKKYCWNQRGPVAVCATSSRVREDWARSEEHTSELQSPCNLVCRLLLEKKKKSQSRRGGRRLDRGGDADRAPARPAAQPVPDLHRLLPGPPHQRQLPRLWLRSILAPRRV